MPMFASARAQPYLIAALACLTLAASAAYDLHRERAQQIDIARTQTAALARLLGEHVQQLLRRADAELQDAARQHQDAAHTLPADGFLTSAGPLPPEATPGAADTDWSRRLRQAPPDGLLIDRPRQAADGSWRLTVGRLARAHAGLPATAWQALVDLRPLQRLFDTADTRNNGFVSLFSSDGWLLATAPRNDALFARNWFNTPMFQEHLPRGPTGTVQQVVVRDGTERLYSYRMVGSYPLVVSAGISMTDALAAWRHRLAWHAALLGAVSLGFFAFAFSMSRSIQRRAQAQQAMAEARNDALRSEAFLRNVTDNLPLRIAYVDKDLRHRFANRAHCEHFGLARDQVLGRTWEALRGQALPRPLAQAIDQALQGVSQSVEIEETDANGKHLALATLLVPDLGPDGSVTGLYAASLDVTDRYAQRQRLDAAVKERETLLREVYHRVKNNLQVIQSLLRLQRRAVRDPAAQQALDESASRVRAMSLVHEKLYQSGSLEAVALRDYTQELLAYLGESTGANAAGIRLEAQVVEARARLEAAIPYGLLVNELVSNSIKHGFAAGAPGRVHLSVDHAGKGLRLTLRDNGTGLPDGFDLDLDASMGLQLASSLTAQLGGRLRAHNDGGSVFIAEMPVFDRSTPTWPPSPMQSP